MGIFQPYALNRLPVRNLGLSEELYHAALVHACVEPFEGPGVARASISTSSTPRNGPKEEGPEKSGALLPP